MTACTFFKYCLLLLSLFTVAPVSSKSTQCKALGSSRAKSLLLPDAYSVNVEVKLMNESTVLLIREDRTVDITSLKVTNKSHVVHCLYYYRQKQLVRVTEDLRGREKRECQVTSLVPKTPCIPNSPWTIPLHELNQISNFSWFPKEKEYPRDIETLHLELCDYDTNHTIRMKLDAYMAVNWILSRSDEMINLIRLEFILPDAYIINDYIDFFTDKKDSEDFTLPHGTFCPGLKISSMKPPRVSVPFSVKSEIVDMGEIKHERLIFDDQKKLVLLELENRNESLGAIRVIYDYNTGYKYTISLLTGQCKMPEKIRLGDFFAKGCNENKGCSLSSPDNYFHADKAAIQYVGKRKVRGVICDVWVGKYKDIFGITNNIVEWYYTSKSWTEEVGTNHENSVIFRMDIWEPGSDTQSIHNFFDFDATPTFWSQFDISPCYSKPEQKIRFTIRLQVDGEKDLLPYTTDKFAVECLHKELSSLKGISPILFSQTMVDYNMQKSAVYLTSTLLAGPKEVKRKSATENFKSLNEVFDSISQTVRSKKWKVSLPVQHGSKNLHLTADKIWKSVMEIEIASTDQSTTSSFPTTKKSSSLQDFSTTMKTRLPTSNIATSTSDALWTSEPSDKHSAETAGRTKIASTPSIPTTKKSSSLQDFSTQSTTKIKTRRPTSIIPTSNIPTSTSDALWTSEPRDKHSAETADQTKIAITTTVTKTTRPVISSSIRSTNVNTVSHSSIFSTNYVTTPAPKWKTNTERVSNDHFQSHFRQSSSTLQQTTKSSFPTTASKPSAKRTSRTRSTGCICPTVSTNSSCRTEALNSDKNPTNATFIGSVCGSFFVGMLFAFVIVSFHSVFCRGKHKPNADFGSLRLNDMSYTRLQ